MEIDYLTAASAFTVGLLGGPHCAAMCGGISASLTYSLAPGVRDKPMRQLPYLLAYNTGRIGTYTLVGVIAGAAGTLLTLGPLSEAAPTVLRIAMAVLITLMGLYVAGWWPAVARLEQIGVPVWRRLQPLMQKLLPVRSIPGALGLGAVWGWLPCGMVYAVLLQALTTGSPVEGGFMMLSFGAGTLPNLLGVGLFAGMLGHWTRRPAVRQTAGALLVALGLTQGLAATTGFQPLGAVC
ncbi:MAG TPA: sulfite exporter TauE/SafE family protein [Gammaproteobacteria bacterium]|nr:sulfite exporter TauE/SafE family protein [Gammaproteobacteria bacterium]